MEAERLKAIREAVEIVRRNRHEVTWYKEKADEYIKATDTLLTLANDVLEGKLAPAKKEMSEERIVDINKTIEPLKEIRGRYETQSNATLYDFAVENRAKISEIINHLNKEEGGK